MKNTKGTEPGATAQNPITVKVTVKTPPAATPPLAPVRQIKRRPRVELEPELEEIAALWSAAKRFEMARKFRRWSRQLRISGFILFHESHPAATPSLPFLGLRKARLN
jgi:hypothetical protein